jgi:hypothetical protein
MQIQHHIDIRTLFNEFSNLVCEWMQIPIRLLPSSVGIGPNKLTPGVPVYDSIGIDHGNDFEDHIVFEILSAPVITDQIVDHPFNHEA